MQLPIRHGQLSLELPGPNTSLDVSFMYRSLCVAGLPLRIPSDKNEFKRSGTGFTLKLVTPEFEMPDYNTSVPIGVPYGPKARLLMIWMATAAKELQGTASRYLEIGPIKDWLKDIGIHPSGNAISLTKEQLIKICHTLFMINVRKDYKDRETIFYHNELFVERGAIGVEDLIHFKEGRMDKVRWPEGIVLTETALKRFSKDVVPIPTNRLKMVAHSASAIDLFLYLNYRLPMIEPGDKELVTWKQLSQQFGSRERMPMSRFKNNVESSLQDALKAYGEAKVEETPDGLVLHHSPPADLCKPYYVLGSIGAPNKVKVMKRRKEVERPDMI